MNILITGANGFLGKNLIEKLVTHDDIHILHYDIGTSELLLEKNLSECDFLFHFAAIHRPKENNEFYKVNDEFFEHILSRLETYNNKCPVLLTSSIQALDNNDYGRSKRIAEQALRNYGKRNNSPVIIYRLFNVFGKWATPNSHSVVATFCHNISRDIPIKISSREIQMKFYYIDDVIASFIDQMRGNGTPDTDGITRLSESCIYPVTLGELADTLYYFRDCDKKGITPETKTAVAEKLLVTYESYRPEN